VKKAILMISFLLVLVLALGGVAAAQGPAPFQFCGDLSEADCAIITAAQAASASLESATTSFNVDMNVTNVPDMEFESLAININGTGSFHIEPELMAQLQAAQQDPARFVNPSESIALLGSLVTGFAGDLTLTISIPPEVAMMMGGSEDETIPESITLGLRMVDGVGYVNLADLAAFIPADEAPPSDWMGMELQPLIAMLSGFMEMGQENMDPAAMEDMISGFMDPAFMNEFVGIERLGDTQVMGQNAAVFRTTINYAAFFESGMFQEMMRTQMAAMAEASGEELTEEDMAEMDEAFGMVGMMYENIDLAIIQTIGLDDSYIHVTEVNMNWDLSSLMAMTGEESEGPAPVFTLNMLVQNGDFNAAPPISAPEDATIVPFSEMMGSGSM
jgi:hypothetical protein